MNISSVNTTAGYTSDKAAGAAPIKPITGAIGAISGPGTTIDGFSQVASIQGDDQQLTKSVDRVIESISGPETTVDRSVHEETNHIIYKIRNKETGEVIREIPEEKLLDMAAKLMEQNGIINGILIDEKI
ncbi:flagellar protein FlaG [Paenibacillus sp. FSL H8-0537]|uniref:flagellar protein FlaG n=1 Tax=Paenibacillus sp. FSL H8-0537 TaxID=2921399 RepID=UPI0031013B87